MTATDSSSHPRDGLSRRNFLKSSTSAALVAGVMARPASARILGANDRINVAVIGCGGMGTTHLRWLANRAKDVGDIQVVSVCELYTRRRQRAREIAELHERDAYLLHGDLLARSDVDACFIATPDHWHGPIAIDCMRAGKDIYLEKPMTRVVGEAKAVSEVARETGAVVQIGNHGASYDQMWRARGIVSSGMIGQTIWSQSSSARNSLGGEWNWGIDPDANPSNIDWETWLGSAPKRPWSPERFFRFRKYWDYSGGIATDLFYHRLGSLSMALGAEFPHRVTGTGGNWVQHDGRDVPDTFFTTIDYPSEHSVVLLGSMANSTGVPQTIRGHTATIHFGGSSGLRVVPDYLYAERFKNEHGTGEIEIEAENPNIGGDVRAPHRLNFFNCVRTRETTNMPARAGYQVMAAISMTVQSYREGKMLFWDAAKEKVVDRDPGMPV